MPYAIVLVDMEEGFRMMAHGDNDLGIGDDVVMQFKSFAGALAPYVVRKRNVKLMCAASSRIHSSAVKNLPQLLHIYSSVDHAV